MMSDVLISLGLITVIFNSVWPSDAIWLHRYLSTILYYILSFTLHILYTITCILPVVKDHLSWDYNIWWSLYTGFTVIYTLVSWTVKHIEMTSTEKLVTNILCSFLKLHLNSLSFCPGGDQLKGIFILRMSLLVCVFVVVLYFCYLLAMVFGIHIWPIYCFNDWYFLFKQKYAH